MTDTPPDADVVAMLRLAAGDDLALNEIMDRWRDKVAAFLQRMTGNTAAAEDLALETFVQLYRHCSTYAPSAAFASYLFRIAANLARNHQRWLLRHPTVALVDEHETLRDCSGNGASPAEGAEMAESLRAVETALAALPCDLREAILLFTYEEMSYSQIASSLRCSEKAVETRIYRARQMLRSLLKNLET